MATASLETTLPPTTTNSTRVNSSAAGPSLDANSITSTRPELELIHQSRTTYTPIHSEAEIQALSDMEAMVQKAAIKLFQRESLEASVESGEVLNAFICKTRDHIEVSYSGKAGLEAANRGFLRNALARVFGKGNHAMLRQWYKAGNIIDLKQPEATSQKPESLSSIINNLKQGIYGLDITYEFKNNVFAAKELKLVTNISKLQETLDAGLTELKNTTVRNLIEQELAQLKQSPEITNKLKAFSTMICSPESVNEMTSSERAQRHAVKSLTEGAAADSWWIAAHRESSHSRTVANQHEMLAFEIKLPVYNSESKTWSLIETSASLARPKAEIGKELTETQINSLLSALTLEQISKVEPQLLEADNLATLIKEAHQFNQDSLTRTMVNEEQVSLN